MIFKFKRHNSNFYNILLNLSRNLFFYKKIGLPDTFETRIYLMFIHFSIIMIITKKKGLKFDQKIYDNVFHNIENNLRELGFGDVAVNKKMKDFNKILYDILLKLDSNKTSNKNIKINKKLIENYFNPINDDKNLEITKLNEYLETFYSFCYELSLNNMLKDIIKFKY